MTSSSLLYDSLLNGASVSSRLKLVPQSLSLEQDFEWIILKACHLSTTLSASLVCIICLMQVY